MTNKTLIISIVVVLAVFAGAVAVYRMQNPSQVSGTQDSQAPSQPISLTPQDQQPTPSSTPPLTPANATSTLSNSGACQRDFNQNTLTNAKVNIQNRVVEIDVKNFGKIRLEFYPTDAPKAVENFLRLANSGYYDCLTFHRVAKGFVIQGGDPKGDGSGGQSAFGAPFADELNPDTPSYKAGYLHGVLAMANSGPNTNGSQFFIMLGDNQLPHLYTIFGKVSSGLDVVDQIGQVAINPVMGPTDGSPLTPVVTQSVKIIK